MIYVSLGSNLGNRLENLRNAMSLIRQQGIFNELSESIILETEAILPPNAPNDWNKAYLNMVIGGTSLLAPNELLSALQNIEHKMGRNQTAKRWAPRIIDLDILLYHDQTINTKILQVPHIELQNRPFLLHLLGFYDYTIPSQNINCTKSLVLDPKLVGIVNVTPDSFSDGDSYLLPELACKQVQMLHEYGASIIELGSQSTRPNSIMVGWEEEYKRLEPVLKWISINLPEIKISIDSFSSEAIEKIIDHFHIHWINDVKGSITDEVLRKAADADCKIVAMHSVTIPPSADCTIPCQIKPMDTIKQWAQHVIQKMITMNFDIKNIILDPGIGFGKTTYQNISLLKTIPELKQLGCEILVGHSRKSYINSFIQTNPSERDLETISISNILQDLKVDYLRVHNIKDHQRFFVAKHSMLMHSEHLSFQNRNE